jgi:hypothetical protein
MQQASATGGTVGIECAVVNEPNAGGHGVLIVVPVARRSDNAQRTVGQRAADGASTNRRCRRCAVRRPGLAGRRAARGSARRTRTGRVAAAEIRAEPMHR